MAEPRQDKTPPPQPKPDTVPKPGSVPKLPQTIFNLEKKGSSGTDGDPGRSDR
jgi:hypothetical protein